MALKVFPMLNFWGINIYCSMLINPAFTAVAVGMSSATIKLHVAELIPVATYEKNGLKSNRDAFYFQDLRSTTQNPFLKIKIENDNQTSGYACFNLSATNGVQMVFISFALSYQSKAVCVRSINSNGEIHCYFDPNEQCTYFSLIGTAYSGTLHCVGAYLTVKNIKIEILKDVDVTSFQEINVE